MALPRKTTMGVGGSPTGYDGRDGDSSEGYCNTFPHLETLQLYLLVLCRTNPETESARSAVSRVRETRGFSIISSLENPRTRKGDQLVTRDFHIIHILISCTCSFNKNPMVARGSNHWNSLLSKISIMAAMGSSQWKSISTWNNVVAARGSNHYCHNSNFKY